MGYISDQLNSVVETLSDENYGQSLAFYRLWFGIGRTYSQITPDQIFDDIWRNNMSKAVSHKSGKLFHPTAHLIIRFASDLESDSTLAPQTTGLQSRLCAKILWTFFPSNIKSLQHESEGNRFVSVANLIASWVNMGYVEESVIHDHILQSLTSFPKLYDHQASAIIVLFKMAGATFEAYADPSVVDRCFQLLKNHYSCNTVKGRLVQVRVANTVEGGH